MGGPASRVSSTAWRLADNNGLYELHMHPGTGTIDFVDMFRRIEAAGFKGHYICAWGTLDQMLLGRDYLVECARKAGIAAAKNALATRNGAMSMSEARKYDPRSFKALTFHDAAAWFREGADSPRAYLERCLETIKEREPVVLAFAALNETGARRRSGCQHRALEGRASALPSSTACPSASRISSKPGICPRRWVARPTTATFPSAMARWLLETVPPVAVG